MGYYIFTFCSKSVYSECYVKLQGTRCETRELMISNYGHSWGFQYPSLDRAGVDKYELREIGLDGRDVL